MFCSRGGRLSFFVHREFDGESAFGLVMALWCTIRTFAKHALELGNQPVVEPIFFIKPEQCLHESGPLPVSAHPGEMHHEVECVVRIGAHGQPVALAVGLDLTDRPAQSELRAEQLPWAKGKCFRSSAVVGQWHEWGLVLGSTQSRKNRSTIGTHRERRTSTVCLFVGNVCTNPSPNGFAFRVGPRSRG